MESKSDDADDADYDYMATMLRGGLSRQQNCFRKKQVGGIVKCEVSCALRFQPCQYLAEARGASASRGLLS